MTQAAGSKSSGGVAQSWPQPLHHQLLTTCARLARSITRQANGEYQKWYIFRSTHFHYWRDGVRLSTAALTKSMKKFTATASFTDQLHNFARRIIERRRQSELSECREISRISQLYLSELLREAPLRPMASRDSKSWCTASKSSRAPEALLRLTNLYSWPQSQAANRWEG